MAAYHLLLDTIPVAQLVENVRGLVGLRLHQEYRDMAPRPVLGQNFEDDLKKVRWAPRTGQLPSFIANLLPEADGPLRALLVKNLGLDNPSEAEVLAALGSDLAGAVEFLQTDSEVEIEASNEPEALKLEPSQNLGLRFSLAGVQLKFSMSLVGERLTLPANGPTGDWIVKLEPSKFEGLAQNEFAMLAWAEAIGIEVPERFIAGPDELESLRGIAPDSLTALAVKRYDRVGTKKIHQEDFAQIFGWMPQRKYDSRTENLLRVATAVLGDAGYEEMLRRVIFAVAIGNHDAHLKNWSLLYRDGVVASHTPAYDQVSTVCWPHLKAELALPLGPTRRPDLVDVALIRSTANKVGQDPDRAQEITSDVVHRLRQTWPDIQSLLPKSHQQAIQGYWAKVPIMSL